MKKTFKLFVLCLAAVLTFGLVAVGCNGGGQPSSGGSSGSGSGSSSSGNATKVSLELSGMRREFSFSEKAFSANDLVVTEKMSDGSSKKIASSDVTIDSSAFRPGEPGTYTIKVSADGLTAEYEATVLEKQKWEEDGVLKILSIGNSFSVNTNQHVPDIAKALGVNIVIGNLAIGGAPVDLHAANFEGNLAEYDYYFYSTETDKRTITTKQTPKEAMQAHKWDYIVMQQQSTDAGQEWSYGNLGKLIAKVNEWKNPEAELAWNFTWAYEDQTTSVPYENYYQRDQMKMYNAIKDCVQSEVLGKTEIKIIIPNGTAIQNARTSYLGNTMTSDGSHVTSRVGEYIIGLTFFSKLSGRSIEDIMWVPSYMKTNKDARLIAIESAMNALENPFEITQSKYGINS